MTDLVFVLHGVGYRGREDDFGAVVAGLADASGLALHPVFWGDLAAREATVRSVVPSTSGRGGLRDDEDPDAPQWHRGGVDLDRGLDPVEAGVLRRLEEVGSTRWAPLLLAQVQECWPEADNLRRVDDVVVLTEVGEAIADLVVDLSPDGYLRGLDRRVLARCLRRFDRLVGATQTATAGRMNSSLRAHLLPGIGRFLGDVLVYQRHQAAIQQRVRDVIGSAGRSLGGEGDPVRVLAHSLGGVIAMDLATAPVPVWVRSLVTFGSQWPLFDLVDPRFSAHRETGPVVLPPAVGGWTNVWEPLDPLAFVTGDRYLLHDGSAPRNVALDHLATWGLWTHSVYWRSHDFLRVLDEVFGKGAGCGDGRG
ncbi:hypothetical protein ALI22I_28670 [Saccharothrix sp. ALI-22-I]|uniref:hypothetical protein n=1 Tax=Saccharothrix sp. ALI-22-I TaxID=1933778 RepID=UPI00097BAF9F|nr:hypothetical protein [Saccharothrix sp. ALI-22-I]ONI84530.1 hypothetical protein ALI22I_28670 [Saccharothrix sp. ALI-22-I]